ncbi:histidine triad nucleotide-binding protein [Arenimonas sp. GDDSR-1]|uniref:histidine triad nucleotide-binding protein n=1 Tax=Arenimonas sp. GDDSR-1 TaxID=2950125 RepID=UPI0026329467|nr:histidine triad nucleotide-binding protein [Arenimonas sp. GDDSR-1]
MSDSIFEKIIKRQIPADIVFESDDIIAFRDISPQAPVHVLFVPKRRFNTLNDVPETEAQLLGNLMLSAQAYAKSIGIAENGYRLVMNCNGHGGQTVFHIHVHLLGGAPLTGGFA